MVDTTIYRFLFLLLILLNFALNINLFDIWKS